MKTVLPRVVGPLTTAVVAATGIIGGGLAVSSAHGFTGTKPPVAVMGAAGSVARQAAVAVSARVTHMSAQPAEYMLDSLLRGYGSTPLVKNAEYMLDATHLQYSHQISRC